MGNFISRCLGVVDKKRKNYLRTDYETEKDFSIEFQNLMDEEPSSSENSRLVLTDREKQLLKTRQFDAIIHEQKQADEEIEAKLAAQEQQIEEEEEAFYEAKREAARISKLNKEKETASKQQRDQNEGWANEDEWEVAGVEEDFDNFLANVKARSQATLSQVKNGSGDAGSQSQTLVKSDTPAQIQVSDVTKEKTTSQLSVNSDATSDDEFEWDSGFVSAEDNDRKQLVEAVNS